VSVEEEEGGREEGRGGGKERERARSWQVQGDGGWRGDDWKRLLKQKQKGKDSGRKGKEERRKEWKKGRDGMEVRDVRKG
jgi:hypothetical protein